MIISKERLIKEQKATGYRQEMIEKVFWLIQILNAIAEDSFLKNRLALKGGTGLNLFHFGLPRLSVDADLNYIGAHDKETMMKERPEIEERIQQLFQCMGLSLSRNPQRHAGGKMVWRYVSALGNQGNIEVDLNFMYRIPLLPVEHKTSVKVAGQQIVNLQLLDIHELAAGKLSALLSRQASRDIFDAHQLLTKSELDKNKLRLTLVIYLAMTDINLNKLKKDFLDCDMIDIRNRLLPLMRQTDIPRAMPELKKWTNKLISELQTELHTILPSNTEESNFINLIRTKGEIKPGLITTDPELAEIILIHPAIKWAAQRNKRK